VGGPCGTGLTVLSGSANPALAALVASCLGEALAPVELERFPDGEARPVVPDVRGRDVYVVQPTCPPVDEHLVELLLLLDASRRAGAARLTAVVPYFGYARQDRRSRPGEPVGARLAAEVIAAAGAQRIVVVDPHTAALEAMSPVPVATLSAARALAAALGPVADAVVVAPDLGAVRLAERYAAIIGAPVAVVRKHRLTAAAVRAGPLAGDVAGRRPVIVDDMVSTGATIEAAAELLADRAGAAPPAVVATHGLFSAGALDRLGHLGLARLLVTDTVPPPRADAVEVCSLAWPLAEAIGRLHREERLDDVAWPG
jgi:ribose-phosphate pyrophosphokinase